MNEQAEAARRALSNALISGIAHDLNGRLGALIGVAHLARSTGSMGEDLLDVLDDQIRRLRDSVHLLRAVPVAAPPPSRQAAPLREIVTGALRLYRCRSGPVLASIQFSDEAGPVLVADAEPLVEAVLLLLAVTERGPGGTTYPVRIECVNGVDGPRVRIERCGPGPTDGEVGIGGVSESAFIGAATACLEAAGGRLERTARNIFEVRPATT